MLTNLSAVLGLLKTEFGRSNEFMGARVIEMNLNNDKEMELYTRLTGD
jgi:hypothetical protein